MSLAGTLNPALRTGEIEIDPTAMKVSVRGSEVVTTDLEFRFLHYLVQNQARVFTREQLLDAIWGSQYVESRSVDACVRRLRRKIELDPKNPGHLKTIRGAGYSLSGGPRLIVPVWRGQRATTQTPHLSLPEGSSPRC